MAYHSIDLKIYFKILFFYIFAFAAYKANIVVKFYKGYGNPHRNKKRDFNFNFCG